MTKLIRTGVFETNSSSAHAISIAADSAAFVLDTIYPDNDGIIVLSGGEFGWEWFKENDAREKANYAAQSFSRNEDLLELLTEVIMEQTGASAVVFNDLSNGYIDHDSYDLVPQNRADLRNFIFNKNSWLFGGNDNDSATPDFYDVPVYNEDGTVTPVIYKYEISVPTLAPRSIKLKDGFTDKELRNALSSLLSYVRLDSNGIISNSWGSNSYEFNSCESSVNSENKTVRFTCHIPNDVIKQHLGDKYNWNDRQQLYDKLPEYSINVPFVLTEI